MTPHEFAAKWIGNTRTERSASQEHFIDICHMLGVPTPNSDPTGEEYAFEKGVEKNLGGDGWADVWKRGHFAWEYKGQRKDLQVAYRQLLDYREALGNPPLLVVCDLNRFEVHTNWTDTIKQVYRFELSDFLHDPGDPIRFLRAVLIEPDQLKPAKTPEALTEQAASQFAALAQRLRGRGAEPLAVAHFLNKLLFCMFAEDVKLLPDGLIVKLAVSTLHKPDLFNAALAELFDKMSVGGGMFGADVIEWFNGGLFDGSDVIPLERDDILTVRDAARLNWAEVEPAIFGTLFERGLNPDKRSQLGAHYTDKSSVARVVDAVVIQPLTVEFDVVKSAVERLLTKKTPANRTRAMKRIDAFLGRLRSVTVLDPACGSGNFLYVALRELKDLEREVIAWASENIGMTQQFPLVSPSCLWGIELDPYAAELARVTIWIGEIQWMIQKGYGYRRDPVLGPMQNIVRGDALLVGAETDTPAEAAWPVAEFIVGNPPFIGAKLLRRRLGWDYVDKLFAVFGDRLPGMSDFVCYWHEKARAMIEQGHARRVGLLATQSIRGGASRVVLERIKGSGDIFMAWSDQPWVLDGASVHVSIVAYDDGSEAERFLDGSRVQNINADLTAGVDVTQAQRLATNAGIAFIADVKGGPFDITATQAREMLRQRNPHGRSNEEVIVPWVNGKDITQRHRGMWIIDFGVDMSEKNAALYEAPFEHVKQYVKPLRDSNARKKYREKWWLHLEPGSGMRAAVRSLQRYLVTPEVAKHRVFKWIEAGTLPDHQLIVIARDDDYTFGVLQSRVHEVWARRNGTQVREAESGFRYTPTTVFETFPFPDASAEERRTVSEVARELDQRREAWLKPAGGPAADLEVRTLTNLYNSAPSWLEHLHLRLDRAVIDAYGWPDYNLTEEDMLSRLLQLNLAQS